MGRTTSFQNLSKHFNVDHIESSLFDTVYEEYQLNKFNEFTIMQRQNAKLTTPAHRAAVFYAVTAQQKIKISEKQLCDLMRCEVKRFKEMKEDVLKTCEIPKLSEPIITKIRAKRKSVRKKRRRSMKNDENIQNVQNVENVRKKRKKSPKNEENENKENINPEIKNEKEQKLEEQKAEYMEFVKSM